MTQAKNVNTVSPGISSHSFGKHISCSTLLAAFVAATACSDGSKPTNPEVGNDVGGARTELTSATGGRVQTGGAPQVTNTGGATSATSSSVGGALTTGGNKATGGASKGGTLMLGGAPATGGTKSNGGAALTGGAKSSGGVPTGGTAAGTSNASGGTKASGGSVAMGDTKASGGAATVGGTSASGGSTSGGSTSTRATVAENTGASCKATSAPLLSAQLKKLPDPFAMHDGTRISTKEQWECRRNEIMADIYKYEIGPKPDPSETTVKATLSDANLSVVVTSSSGSLTLKTAVSGSGSCVVIATDMDLKIISGCTNVTFSTNDVIPYSSGTGSQKQSDPFYKVFPSLWGKIGNYTAWSWGVSRLIDGLEQVKDQLKIDTTKIATHGCSYAGKMALFAGALDERVALTVAQESGGGGINSWRASADFKSRTGKDVEKIDNTNYAWFMSSMKGLDPYKLPHDHHELIAAVAPRAIIILGNPGYEWLGDESGYKSTMAALEVFKALGVADSIGYDFTGNHDHCAAASSQKSNINAFADKYLKDKASTSTNAAIKPSASNFDLTADFDWTTPALQ